MFKIVKALVPMVALMVSGFAYAAQPASDTIKIGVVDMQALMQQSPDVSTVNKRLQSEFQPRQQKIVAAQKNLQEEIAQLNKNGPTMSNDARTKLKDKIISDRAEWQAMVQSFQQDLAGAQSQAMHKLMGQLQTAVDNVAKQGNYTIIVQRAAVLYMQPDMNVTKQVVAAMPKE